MVLRILLFMSLLLLINCQPSLEHQPKLLPYDSSRFFSNGSGVRAPVPGTVPFYQSDESIPELNASLVMTGRTSYNIHCAVCHGQGGDGKGIATKRGFPVSPTFHSPEARLRSAKNLYEVISQGTESMPAFAASLTPTERWALVSYIRALQLSQHMSISKLSVHDLESMAEEDL